jgi:hypothetical protein
MVTFYLSPSHVKVVSGAAPPTQTSTQEYENAVNVAKAQLEKKQVVLDKLGKFSTVLDALKIAGEALGDVRMQ